MTNKIIFVTPFKDSSHIELEANIIKNYIDIYKNYKFILLSGEKHGNKVKKELKKQKKNLTIIPLGNSKIPFFIKTTIYLWFFRKEKKIHLAYDPYTLPLQTCVPFLFAFDVIFMHGYWREINKSINKYLHLFLLKRLILRKNTKIISLGKWIALNINKDRLLKKSEKRKFFWIYHPAKKSKGKRKKKKKVNFGLLGRPGNHYKNVILSNIKKIRTEIKKAGGTFLSGGKHFISKQKYIDILNNSDYILNFSTKYDYRCSGIIIEAICSGKPIVGISNTMIEFLKKEVGDIGYVYKNVEKVDIKKICQDFIRKEKYKNQKRNIKKLEQKYTDQELIRYQIKKIGI